MSESSDIRNLLNSKFRAKQDKVMVLPGRLGDGHGNLYVTGRTNYVYARLTSMTVEVFNNRVLPENDLMVMVGYDPAQPNLFQVLSTRSAQPGGTYGGALSGPPPAIRYQWLADGGGQDPLFVEKRQYLPLRIGASAGMFLQIYRDFVWSGTEFLFVDTQTVNLASYRPSTTGTAAFVLITLDSTGTAVATKGSEVDVASLAMTDLPAIPDGTANVLGAVRVYNGQTAIQEARTNTDIVDLRFSGWTGDSGDASTADHDHSGAADSGGQFFLTNLLSTGANVGQLPTADGSGGILWQDFPVNNISLVSELSAGTLSGELFTLPTGINEFDLLYVDGYYHLFYQKWETGAGTKHRQATTIAGLSSASDDAISSYYYPGAYYDGSLWHIWVVDDTSSPYHIKHYTCATAGGTYTLSDTLTKTGVVDPEVRRGYDGLYYLGYADVDDSKIGVMSASSLAGPWTDLGYVFSESPLSYSWEGDPYPIFYGGRAYMAFSPYDGSFHQTVQIVEVDPATFKALTAPTILVEPTESWQNVGDGDMVFSPVFLAIETEPGRARLYYSVDQGWPTTHTTAGWGYVQIGNPLVNISDTSTIDLAISGGAISATLKDTTIAAGSYRNPAITFDAQGRATAASNGNTAEVLMADGEATATQLTNEEDTDWLYGD